MLEEWLLQGVDAILNTEMKADKEVSLVTSCHHAMVNHVNWNHGPAFTSSISGMLGVLTVLTIVYLRIFVWGFTMVYHHCWRMLSDPDPVPRRGVQTFLASSPRGDRSAIASTAQGMMIEENTWCFIAQS